VGDWGYGPLRVTKHRKKDQDWPDVGFLLIGHVEPTPEELVLQPRIYTTWRQLGRSLDEGRRG
jgi:hypothetical protein